MEVLPTKLWDELSSVLQENGFPVSGVVDYDLAIEEYQKHAERYREWIERGFHGSMKYLERGFERRANPKLVFPELKSVITVFRPYSPHPVGEASGLKYARYLNAPDYHETMKGDLEKVFLKMKESHSDPSAFQYKVCVDTSAVLERTWAALTGLGWIGKNTLLIHPQLGSYAFLGVVFTNIEFRASPKLLKDYCGTCTRCIQSCPTEALEPHTVDSKKCISYLTLEHRGPFESEYPLSGYLAGCDLCQEACPFNTKAVQNMPFTEIHPTLESDSQVLIDESETQYNARVQHSALDRIRYQDFKRNLNENLKHFSVRK